MVMTRGVLVHAATGAPLPEYVQRMGARGFGVTVDDLTSRRTYKHLAIPRFVTMAAIREMCGLSYPAIGRMFGPEGHARDHKTVISACRRVDGDAGMTLAKDRLIKEVRRQWAIDHGLSPVPVSTPVAGVVVST